MKKRTLTRRVMIREYDFVKVREQAFTPLTSIGILDPLYDRAEFTPISQDSLEKLKILEILKGRKTKLSDVDLDLKMPAVLVAQLKDYLYNDRYYRWKVTVDDDGYVCVQARKNTPKSRLGWAVFEKDLESRL